MTRNKGGDQIATDSASGVSNQSENGAGFSNKNTMKATAMKKLIEADDLTNSSIIEFLNQEQNCLENDQNSEVDIDSIFEEINRLSGDPPDDRSVDEILREAEQLLSDRQQLEAVDGERWKFGDLLKTISEESTPREMRSGADLDGVSEAEQVGIFG